MTDRKNLITISDVTKKFGRKVVLSGINLEINRSDSIAFIGRNGYGKSTLLKIIAGLLPFEKGEVTHNGKLKFGYIPERFPAMNLTAGKYLRQIGMISGLQKEKSESKSNELAKALFMQDMMDTPIRHLSKGTIQKVAVIQAFLTMPDVLLLDEPISGQDMASQRVFVEMVNSLNREHGVTILCSLHEEYMIRTIANSVYEIEGGKLHRAPQSEKPEIGNLCRLLFAEKLTGNTGSALPIPQFVRDTSVKLEELEGREIAIYVMPSESNGIIHEMLHYNFELRGMNNERLF